VPLELMSMHAQAVARGSSRALVVVDMPFGSYEESPAIAFRNAARVLKETGCGAIKLEGGVQMADTIRYLTERGIPVMSHIGMTPQAINTIGSFKPRGRYRSEWAAYEADAKASADAGACAGVSEALAELLAARITKEIPIPTIGIGASAECDGQILVLEDMLGLSPRVPKFVKEYAQIGAGIEAAVKAFAIEVRTRAFPTADYTYPMCEEVGEVTKKTKMTGS